MRCGMRGVGPCGKRCCERKGAAYGYGANHQQACERSASSARPVPRQAFEERTKGHWGHKRRIIHRTAQLAHKSIAQPALQHQIQPMLSTTNQRHCTLRERPMRTAAEGPKPFGSMSKPAPLRGAGRACGAQEADALRERHPARKAQPAAPAERAQQPQRRQQLPRARASRQAEARRSAGRLQTLSARAPGAAQVCGPLAQHSQQLTCTMPRPAFRTAPRAHTLHSYSCVAQDALKKHSGLCNAHMTTQIQPQPIHMPSPLGRCRRGLPGSRLGQHGGLRGAGDAPAQPEDEQRVEHQVDRVAAQCGRQRRARVAQAPEHALPSTPSISSAH